MESTFKSAKRGGFIYTATLLLFLAVSVLGQWVLKLAGATETVYFAVSSLFSVSVLAAAAFFSTRGKPKMPYIGKFSYKFIVPALLLAFGMFLGLGFLNLLVAKVVKSIGGVVIDVKIPLDTPFQFVLFTITLCILPALFEEMFFRGEILDNLSGVRKISGILTVALCFALYHLSIIKFCYQFIYGVGLSVLALKAKSVIPSIIAHFINNFFVLAVEYFKIRIDLFNPFIIGVGVVLLAGFAVFMIFVDRKKKTQTEPKESAISFYFPFGAVGLFACAILAVVSVLPL